MARSDQAAGAVAVNLGSDTPFANPTFGVWVGGAGNLKVDMLNGDAASIGVVFTAVPAGSLMPIQVTKIYSTVNGTTATNIVALRQ